MGCFVRGGKNGMGCYVRGDKNSMGCYVRGDKDSMGCFVRGDKTLWDVLSGVSKNGMGCFVPGCFVRLPIYFNNALNIYMTLSSADNPLQTIWTLIRLDILSRPYRGPDCLTL